MIIHIPANKSININAFLSFLISTRVEKCAPRIAPRATLKAAGNAKFQSTPVLRPCPRKPSVDENRTITEFVAKAMRRGTPPKITNKGTINPPPEIPTIPATNPIAKIKGNTRIGIS